MQSKECVRLTLPGDLDPECLREQWHVEIHPQETQVLTFWDTFEWGVWFGGHLLYSCGEVYHLCIRDIPEGGWLGSVVCEERGGGRRRFWREFETEPMRAKLKPMLGLRGLVPVVEGTFISRRCDLLNEAEKIVCRLEWASVYAGRRGEEELLQSCRVSPLHGYETEAAQLVEYLLERKAVPCGDGPFEALLQYAKQVPRKYTLRPDFGLEMTTPAREAVGRIVRTILEIAVSNVPGILEDLDTEFLHDYRICLRKIRSVLTLLKDVYPAEGTLRVRKILGDLARQTNRLRDLDVHLLAHDEYLGLLPPDFRPVMTEMFDDFSLERGKEVRRTLPKIRTGGLLLLEMGKYFSGESVHEPSRASSLAVGPLVFRSIYKRYRKIREIAAGIGAHTPDEAVHQVRIECKKLRYLMEFFGEFIPVEQGPALQKSLRRLQSRLGEFNDASVQQKSLMSYWEQKKPGSEVALGLGGLVSILYHLQQQSRALIEQALEGFCGDATAATFKHTFKLPANVAAMDVKRSKQQ